MFSVIGNFVSSKGDDGVLYFKDGERCFYEMQVDGEFKGDGEHFHDWYAVIAGENVVQFSKDVSRLTPEGLLVGVVDEQALYDQMFNTSDLSTYDWIDASIQLHIKTTQEKQTELINTIDAELRNMQDLALRAQLEGRQQLLQARMLFMDELRTLRKWNGTGDIPDIPAAPAYFDEFEGV